MNFCLFLHTRATPWRRGPKYILKYSHRCRSSTFLWAYEDFLNLLMIIPKKMCNDKRFNLCLLFFVCFFFFGLVWLVILLRCILNRSREDLHKKLHDFDFGLVEGGGVMWWKIQICNLYETDVNYLEWIPAISRIRKIRQYIRIVYAVGWDVRMKCN